MYVIRFNPHTMLEVLWKEKLRKGKNLDNLFAWAHMNLNLGSCDLKKIDSFHQMPWVTEKLEFQMGSLVAHGEKSLGLRAVRLLNGID
jgi:hypothetical protein